MLLTLTIFLDDSTLAHAYVLFMLYYSMFIFDAHGIVVTLRVTSFVMCWITFISIFLNLLFSKLCLIMLEVVLGKAQAQAQEIVGVCASKVGNKDLGS